MLETIINNPSLFIGLLFIIITTLFYTKPKASVYLLKNEIENYNNMITDYNISVKNFCNIQNKLLNEKQLNNLQLKTIKELSQKFQSICSGFLVHSEMIETYINKKNLVYYRKYKKNADENMEELELLYDKLNEMYNTTEDKYSEYNREEYTNSCYNSDENDESEYNNRHDNSLANNTNNNIFFIGCNTEEEVKKRYKSLVKIYHPDMQNGNSETFRNITNEYEIILSKLDITEKTNEGADDLT